MECSFKYSIIKKWFKLKKQNRKQYAVYGLWDFYGKIHFGILKESEAKSINKLDVPYEMFCKVNKFLSKRKTNMYLTSPKHIINDYLSKHKNEQRNKLARRSFESSKESMFYK